MSARRKYLAVYAEPHDDVLERLAGCRFDHVVVIPACRERADFLEHLPAFGVPVLVIVVVNQPAGAIDSANVRLWERLGGKAGRLSLTTMAGRALTCLGVDAFRGPRALPPDGGVGHARKLGADSALALIEAGVVRTTWIANTDCDACLPDDYFAPLCAPATGEAARLFPFRHRGGPGTHPAVLEATLRYELSLHHYVEGLRWAGSPYAFHTVGSTIAIDAGAYAKVRGFPRRAAAEDFYLLNKLAKVGAVTTLDRPVIELAARVSDRVPFGTGAAVGRIVDGGERALFYATEVFAALRNWLQLIPALADERAEVTDLENCHPAGRAVLCWLRTQRIDAAMAHARRHSSDAAGFERHLRDWFDGFRTLKLIHHLRDACFPSQELEALLKDRSAGPPWLATGGIWAERIDAWRSSHSQLDELDYRL